MAQESRLVIVIDSKNAEKNAKSLADEMSKVSETGDSASRSSKEMGKQITITNNIVQNFNTTVNHTSSVMEKATKAVEEAGKEATVTSGKFSTLKQSLTDSIGNTRFGGMINDVNNKLASLNGTAGIVAAGLAGMAVGGVATATSALALMAIQSAKADAQLAIISKRANVSTTNFQILEKAALQLGMSQDGLSQSLADAQEKLGEFTASGGSGEAADFFDALKNNTKMTDKQIKEFAKTLQGKDGVEVLQIMKNKLDELGASAQEQRFIFESLGNDLGNLLPLFEDGGKLLKEFGEALEEAGVIKSKEAIDQAKVLAAQTQAINLQFQGAKNQLVSGFTPALVGMAEAMFSSSENGVTLKDVGEGLGTVFKTVGTVALGTATFVKILGDGMGALAALTVQLVKGDFKSAAAIWEDSASSLDESFQDMFMRLDKMWNFTGTATSSTNNLTNALLSLNNATDNQNKGLKVNAKDAKEAEQATAKLAKEQENLNKLVGASALSGLRIKSMESVAGGKVRGYTAEFAQLAQELLGDKLTRFTAFNDSYHKGTNSKHSTGNAFDFTVKSAKEAEAAVAKLNEMAVKYGFTIKTINEYANPSKRATGGHVHVSVLGFKGGNEQIKDAKAEAKLIDESYQSRLKVMNQIKSMQSNFDSEAVSRSKARDDEINKATLLGQTQLIPKIKERYAAQDKIAQLQLDNELNGYKWTEEQKLEVTKQINILRLDAEGKLSDDQKAIAKKALADSFAYQSSALEIMRVKRLLDSRQFYMTEIQLIKERFQIERNEIERNAELTADEIKKRTNLLNAEEQSVLLARAGYANQNWQSSYAEMTGNSQMFQLDQTRQDRTGQSLAIVDAQMALAESAAEQEAIWQAHRDRMALIDQDYWNNTKAYQLGMAADVFGGLSGVMLNFVDESSNAYRLMIAAQKGANLASVFMSNIAAISAAWSSAPFPANLPAVAITTAKTGVLQATLQAFSPQGFATGGQIRGPGTGTSDSIPIMASNKEFMVKASSAASIGLDNLNYMNRTGELPTNHDAAQLSAIQRQQRQSDLINTSISQRSAGAIQNAAPTVVDNKLEVNNFVDWDTGVPEAMATPAGTRVVMNIIRREKSKINAMLGMP